MQQSITKTKGGKVMKHEKEKSKGKLIVCVECGEASGTLVKRGDEYVHQDSGRCKILKFRKK